MARSPLLSCIYASCNSEEHRRREPECPYFTATLLPAQPAQTDNTPEDGSKRRAATAKKGARAAAAAAEEEEAQAHLDTAESAAETDSEVPK